MTRPVKLAAGGQFPPLHWPAIDGGRIDPNAQDGWRLLIVYRGKHCPLCKKYLGRLQELREDFAQAGIWFAAISADPLDRAKSNAQENGWTFPVGAELSPEEMRQLGLYVSHPRSPQETDRDFAEPGVFALNPNGTLQIVDVSNAPFARPELENLLSGLKFIQDKDYPIRGTA